MQPGHINPIIPGFAPDPSIVLIDDNFFLVNSSFHIFPGLPIYTSTDLIVWKHIGNAINRQSQLSLQASGTDLWPADDHGEVMLATGGLYAPTIRYFGGVVYIVCTNILRQQDSTHIRPNFIITTKDIWSNEWSDPVYFEFDGIDPSLFFDEDGSAYIQGSAAGNPLTTIHLFKVEIQTGRKLSEQKKIWDGTGGIYPEGPHIYKKDGFYYLLISEGGTHQGHMITVARATDIWGPYESCPKNPILTARGTQEYIQYTGHCDMFQDQDRNWWGVCLGVRKDAAGRFVMGRETFITKGEWPEGEWPALSRVTMEPPIPGREQLKDLKGNSTFSSLPLVDYVYIRDAVLDDHRFSSNGNTISLTPSVNDISQWKEPVTFVGQRQRVLKGTSFVSMHHTSFPIHSQLLAGLAYYKDEHRHMKLFYDFTALTMNFEIKNTAKSISKTCSRKFNLKSLVVLRIEYTETSYRFSYRAGETKQWTSFEPIDSLDMTGPDFVGPVIGVFASAKSRGLEVKFDGLVIV